MSLRGPLARQQRTVAKFYRDLARCFPDNALVLESWESMAGDLEQQAESLQSIPQRFWSQLGESEQIVEKALSDSPRPNAGALSGDHSIRNSFSLALHLEEPMTLGVCAPLIRKLRLESRGHGLDYYIMVKAHLARLNRLVRQFSGDPVLIQKATSLLDGFEHEVQAPGIPVPVRPRKVPRAKPRARAASGRAGARKKATGTTTALKGRAKKVASRTKRLVAKVALRTRRARR